jgi:hypothetical protein
LVAFGASASVAQASLSVPTGGPPTTFTGAGTLGAANALAAFEAAVGGADNRTAAGEQGSGFRHVTWEGIAVDGSEPGSRAVPGGHVVAPARSRLQPWGLELGPEIAVANDAFQSVSSAHFTPFSAPNVWGPFNSSTAEFDVVAPVDQGTTPSPAQTRGLGIVFLGATGSTHIQYFNGSNLLAQGTVSALPGTTSFAGLLFPDPVVTRVVVTLGGSQIFGFDGTTVTPGGSSSVAGDDIVLAEPAPARASVSATAGVPISPVLDTFTNTESQASATIDWGDGTRAAGTIAPAPGGAFSVTGTHAYSATGTYTATVTVRDFAGDEQTSQTTIQVAARSSATTVTCSPSSVAVSASTTCTAVVSDLGGGAPVTPSGIVAFTSPTAGASFASDSGCILGPSTTPGVALCVTQFTPGQLPPNTARVAAAYGGDAAHAASASDTTIAVHRQRCSVRALSRRLRSAGLGVLVTCDARAKVQIAVKAVAPRKGRFGAIQLSFGTLRATVGAGRPTVLVIKPVRGVLPVLRAAARRHQHVTLKLTLTASSRSIRTTTSARLPAVRVS